MTYATTLKQKITLIIFGLILCMVILEIGLRIGGVVYLSIQEHRNRVPLDQKGNQYRILCLGDSNTALGGSDSYPGQLERILNQRVPDMEFVVINKGVPGASSTFIVSQLKYNLDRYAPHMVITMMGASDMGTILSAKEKILLRIKNFLKTLRLYKLARLLQMRIWENKILHQKYLDLGEYYQSQENFYQSEEMFKLAIKIYPNNWEDYIRLGWCYHEQGKYSQAEEMFEKAIEINPNSLDGHIALGNCYNEQGKYSQAEEMFKKAMTIKPGDDTIYLELALYYQERQMYPEAEEMFEKAIEINPNSLGAYTALGWCYREQEKYSQAEEIFKKAITINPADDAIYYELAQYYQERQMYPEAEEMFKKAITIKPQEDDTIYFELALYYQERQMYPEAEEMFKKAIEINPNNDYAYRSQGLLNQLKGRYKESELYFNKAEFLTGYCNRITRRNYQRLKDIVLKRGIKLVCATYPMRSLKSLMSMFDPLGGITFVDNEVVFKEALKNGKYQDYFLDRYGGDYGHCTPRGNKLLADNIAEVILKEYFDK